MQQVKSFTNEVVVWSGISMTFDYDWVEGGAVARWLEMCLGSV